MSEEQFLKLWQEDPRKADAIVASLFEAKPVYTHSLEPMDERVWSKDGFWYECCCYEDGDIPTWYPAALTTWSGMELVVEKMREKGWSGYVGFGEYGCEAEFERGDSNSPDCEWGAAEITPETMDRTAPLAIASAALKAEGEIEG
jgi:hypothetical protein